MDVVKGKKTKVLEGVKEKTALESHCFSILMSDRTLDLQVRDNSLGSKAFASLSNL